MLNQTFQQRQYSCCNHKSQHPFDQFDVALNLGNALIMEDPAL